MSEHEQLRGALDALEAQLGDMRSLDPDVAAHLDANIEQARSVLSGGTAGPQEHRSLVEQLKDSVLKYEASHPTLAGSIGSVIDALGRMGI